MNAKRLQLTAVAVVVVALVTVIVWQQGRAKRLMAEADALREQVGQLATSREESERLTEQLRVASERFKADAKELARLRGQAVRMRQIEQESARLKAERERSSKPPTSSPVSPDNQTPEWVVANARMRFSKVLGLSILSFASDNGWQMPTNIPAAVSSLGEGEWAEMLAGQMPPEAAGHDIREEQFELVFRGRLDPTGRKSAPTILARAKEPVQLSNGRWARPCVFDDASGTVLVADTLEELAATEKRLMQPPTSP